MNLTKKEAKKAYKLRNANKTSDIQERLNRYMYLPKRSTAKKLKFFYAPYNQYECMAKYAPLPLGPGQTQEESDLWGRLSNYILEEMDKTMSITNLADHKRNDFIKMSNHKRNDMDNRKKLINERNSPNNQNIIRSPEPKGSIPMLKLGAAPGIKRKRIDSMNMKRSLLQKKELAKYLPTKILPMSPLIGKRKIGIKKSEILSHFADGKTRKNGSRMERNFGNVCRRSLDFSPKHHNASVDVTRGLRPNTHLGDETFESSCESISIPKLTPKAMRKNSDNDKMKLLYASFGYQGRKESQFKREMIKKAYKRFNSIDAIDSC